MFLGYYTEYLWGKILGRFTFPKFKTNPSTLQWFSKSLWRQCSKVFYSQLGHDSRNSKNNIESTSCFWMHLSIVQDLYIYVCVCVYVYIYIHIDSIIDIIAPYNHQPAK
jgi:hypothetical protein